MTKTNKQKNTVLKVHKVPYNIPFEIRKKEEQLNSLKYNRSLSYIYSYKVTTLNKKVILPERTNALEQQLDLVHIRLTSNVVLIRDPMQPKYVQNL